MVTGGLAAVAAPIAGRAPVQGSKIAILSPGITHDSVINDPFPWERSVKVGYDAN